MGEFPSCPNYIQINTSDGTQQLCMGVFSSKWRNDGAGKPLIVIPVLQPDGSTSGYTLRECIPATIAKNETQLGTRLGQCSGNPTRRIPQLPPK